VRKRKTMPRVDNEQGVTILAGDVFARDNSSSRKR
jgi:hypothetical protein